MTEPASFQSETPRLGLPLLFAAQAQKEVVINEALLALDASVHLAVEDETSAPPATVNEGQCWLVAASASGAWEDHDGQIACLCGGDWLFLVPRDGMRCWLAATGQWLRFENGWIRAEKPATPAGGQNVDAESRLAIEQLINALTVAGIFPR